MAKTSSIKFPNMIDPARNTVTVVTDSESVVNRSKLLMLTDPTSLYNEPEFGVGLKQYLWQYNNDATRGVVRDRIKMQLDMWEPCVDAEKTEILDGLMFTEGSTVSAQSSNTLKLTVGLKTIFGEDADVEFDDLEARYNAQNA